MKRFILFFLITILSSCIKDYLEHPVCDVQDVSFSNDIIPIFNDKCVTSTCHSGSPPPPDLTATNAYSSLTTGGYLENTTDANPFYVKITEGTMAQYVTPCEQSKILNWIEQGANDN